MKKKFVFIGVFILIFCLIISNYFSFNKIVVDEKQSLSKNSNMISMMLEQNYGAGDYEETSLNDFPTEGYIFNESLSGCENGGKLSWNDDNKKIVLKGNISDKCYAYFDKYNFVVIKNVVVTGTTSNSISINVISEKGSSDISSYYYSISSNSLDINFINCADTSYTFTDLISNTIYYIKVYAVDINGKASNVYNLTQESGVLYTWEKYNINEVTKYITQTNSDDGRIYIHYMDSDKEWQSEDIDVYYSYSIDSNGVISCSIKEKTILITRRICTNCPTNDEYIYRDLTDDEINERFSPYVGRYVCYNDDVMIIKSNMTSSRNYGTNARRWVITDTITAVANGTTKSKGTYIEDVTSDNSSAYPSNGVSGSYWYVKK